MSGEKRICTRLTESLHRRTKLFAIQRGMPMDALVEEIVDRAVPHYRITDESPQPGRTDRVERKLNT